MSDYERRFAGELQKVRAKIADAAAGAGGNLEPAFRAAMDHAIGALPVDLAALRDHGFADVDGGSYFLGSQFLAFAVQGINPLDALHHPLMARLLREYVDRARAIR